MLFKRLRKCIPAYMLLLAIILNIAAWSSASFCDFYVTHFFPVIVATYGRFSGYFSFSLGEWMLLAAFVLIIVIFGGGLVCLAGRRFFGWYRWYMKICAWVGAIVCLVMTLNCLILYHCSPLTEQYVIGKGEMGQYDVEELTLLRDYVVVEANLLAEQVSRDENGEAVYYGDMISQAQTEMGRLGEKYSRLSGYYPRPKPFFNSNFFSQQYIMGYYFPFSMEANYNTTMYIVNTPVTLCHELSHLKGFIYEDEANFIAYLACVNSEDPLFRYSAYLSVIGYLDRDFYSAIGKDAAVYMSHPAVSEQVMRDDVFLTPDAWEQVEETAILDTQLVKEVSNEIMETNLTLNGVADGTASYGRVVELLLQYYEGELYGEYY